MRKQYSNLILCLLITFFVTTQANAQATDDTNKPSDLNSTDIVSAVFAGGCFWCIEADFEKLDGVIDVVSGYTGGDASTAQYKTVTYEDTGHFEAVKVTYKPSEVSYAELVEYFWLHIDPTDPRGQFCDKGDSYKSAIFYASEQEKTIIDLSLTQLNQNKPFADDIVTTIAAAKPFYLAEDYHQDYYKKNPIRYNYYRRGCGRDARVKEIWGK